ncbi:hypothetical protein GQ600_21263 [Phytophthora cactorum]|nr:hypothetical protein GQ600_21263 [Phytophthora cactorum]
MDLLEAIRKEVLKQKEEEALNFFSTFITTANRYGCERHGQDDVLDVGGVNGDHGTRVTLIDANQPLGELTVVKRKPYIAQIMVWDAKANKGQAGHGVSSGAVYVFHQVDGVGFYADIAKGSVQFESEMRKIVEVAAPIAKRKPTWAARRKPGQDTARGDKPDLEPEKEGEGDLS